ncbi:MAG: hypothetical protein ABSH08_09915 [Tepidisphaeraceae bacterium]|jgi:hypothetical protein
MVYDINVNPQGNPIFTAEEPIGAVVTVKPPTALARVVLEMVALAVLWV